MPSRKPYRFLKKLGFYQHKAYYLPLVSSNGKKFSFVKHLYLIDPDSKDFQKRLLCLAVANEEAAKELIQDQKHRESRAWEENRKAEKASVNAQEVLEVMN